jgi:hypothetical protein
MFVHIVIHVLVHIVNTCACSLCIHSVSEDRSLRDGHPKSSKQPHRSVLAKEMQLRMLGKLDCSRTWVPLSKTCQGPFGLSERPRVFNICWLLPPRLDSETCQKLLAVRQGVQPLLTPFPVSGGCAYCKGPRIFFVGAM